MKFVYNRLKESKIIKKQHPVLTCFGCCVMPKTPTFIRTFKSRNGSYIERWVIFKLTEDMLLSVFALFEVDHGSWDCLYHAIYYLNISFSRSSTL